MGVDQPIRSAVLDIYLGSLEFCSDNPPVDGFPQLNPVIVNGDQICQGNLNPGDKVEITWKVIASDNACVQMRKWCANSVIQPLINNVTLE